MDLDLLHRRQLFLMLFVADSEAERASLPSIAVTEATFTQTLEWRSRLYANTGITVKPLMFAAINVCVFTRSTILLPLKFAFYVEYFFGRVG